MRRFTGFESDDAFSRIKRIICARDPADGAGPASGHGPNAGIDALHGRDDVLSHVPPPAEESARTRRIAKDN